MEAIEVTRLSHGFYVTSHLRATYDAAVKMCETHMVNLRNCRLVNDLADPKLTAVTLKVKRRPLLSANMRTLPSFLLSRSVLLGSSSR